MYTVLIAPDKFKGSLTAMEVCEAIQRGIQRYDSSIKCIHHPLADGGEGSIDLIHNHLQSQKVRCQSTNPIGKNIQSYYYKSQTTAFIELAQSSGLNLLEHNEQNPLYTSTLGTGTLISNAIQSGIKNIYLFVGGSATNDGGIGIAHALGYRFLDQAGQVLTPIGAHLIKIHAIDRSQVSRIVKKTKFTVLCDVNNPLYGRNGAAHIYAPQKGANKLEVIQLDNGLRNLAAIIQKDFNISIDSISGGGAAGGVAAGMVALFNATIQSGIEEIIRITNIRNKVIQADLVISGEGQIDQQTLSGKVVKHISELAKEYQTPLVLFAGQNQLSSQDSTVFNAISIQTILEHTTDLAAAIKNSSSTLEQMSYSLMKDHY